MLAHPSSDVRRSALLATSKLMLAQWSFVQQAKRPSR